MRFCFISIFLLFLTNLSHAQLPKIDTQLREQFFQQKVESRKKMMLAEQQKTQNQEDFDVKYYSLDLTPDPSTSILWGTVEIVTVLACDIK